MDGQLGREKTASQPSPIIFGNSRDSAEEVRRGGTVFFKSGAKLRTLHDERKPPKVNSLDPIFIRDLVARMVICLLIDSWTEI